MIDTKELRRKLRSDDPIDHIDIHANVKPVLTELLDRLEAAEEERDTHKAVTEAYQRGYATGQEEIAAELEFAKREVANLHDDIHELIDERDALRAKIAEMEQQEPECEVVGQVHNVLYEVRTLKYDLPAGTKLYALPGAQNVPKEAIAKILTEVMNIAVSNGADSRSMPDEYVEVAAWLCGMPAQNVPSVPDVDALAQFIREIDGKHQLGAGALAERIVEWLAEAPEAKP